MNRIEEIRARLQAAEGSHECGLTYCDGSGPWPPPWELEEDIKGDGHWDNEFHVHLGVGSPVTFAFHPHADLFAHIPDDLRYLLDIAEEARNVLEAHDLAQEPDADQDWTGPTVDLRLRAALNKRQT